MAFPRYANGNECVSLMVERMPCYKFGRYNDPATEEMMQPMKARCSGGVAMD
jgi:hypothetical protein